VTGRRRNGFCSDRCRMQIRRAEQQGKVREALLGITQALRAMEQAVSRLEGELGENSPTEACASLPVETATVPRTGGTSAARPALPEPLATTNRDDGT